MDGFSSSMCCFIQNAPLTLEELDVSRNYIDDEGAAALVDLLVTMRDFHTLHLRDSDCTANGLRAFTRLLQPSSKITTLDLGMNDFNDEVIYDFADVLANNSTLTTLHIGGDEITDRSWTALSRILCDESSIKNTYSFNHTLHTLEKFDDVQVKIPDDLSMLLLLNKNQDKASVRRQKILIHHFHETVRGIVVKGCGIPEINGYFTQSGSFDDVPMYTKSSLYQGHKTVFSMFRRKICIHEMRGWFISIVPMNAAHPGTDEDIHFYAVKSDAGDGNLPPQTNWVCNGISSSPAPKIDIIRGSVDTQVFAIMSSAVLSCALEWIGRDTLGFSLMYTVIRANPSLFVSKIML